MKTPRIELPWSRLKHTFHTSSTFMDYLHGDVKKEEAQLACAYECARESEVLWMAAEERDNFPPENESGYEKVTLRIVEKMVLRGLAPPSLLHRSWEWRFLMCKSFPTRDWNELSDRERQFILRYETRQYPPLRMPDVLWEPQVWAMHSAFKELARVNEQPIPEVLRAREIPPIPPVPAMVNKSGPVHYCVMEVDFSESKDSLKKQFTAWLGVAEIKRLLQKHKRPKINLGGRPLQQRKVQRNQDAKFWVLFEVDLSALKGDLVKHFVTWLARAENRKRLRQYGKQKRGKTSECLDRLKDLAAWRLYREVGNDFDKANSFANDNRKTFMSWREIIATTKKINGKWPYQIRDFRPFHNARTVEGEYPSNKAKLYSSEEDYLHAKGRVLKHLSEWYPGEYGRQWLTSE